ncbi:MAG TPA: GNAT family N-acetyltransferase [Ideonella sp.]|nr:GNAT family N-acetyltransferase [Ideonella sp.]
MTTDPPSASKRDPEHPGRLFSWVPIRSLAPRHRPRMLAHLQQLNERDRYLRFGYAATDEQMASYVASIDFRRDEVFGIFDRRLRLIALAHLAYMWPTRPNADNTLAEFGVSVLSHARGRGFGERLFDHAVLHARNRGIDKLLIHALSENAVMLQLARKAGAEVHRDGSESEALLKLPPDTIASQVGALVEDGAAELDYGIKRQARRLDRLLHALADRARARS